MRVRLVRRPGQHGTKTYLEQYGDRLVCVRYRYDEAARRRYKTIELIVEEREWEPREKAQVNSTPQFPPDALVGVRVIWGEVEIARELRRMGAEWRKDLQLWEAPYAKAVALGLTDRIIGTIAELRAARARKDRGQAPR